MSQVFSNGELKSVYYKIKVVNGKTQFRRAPFDVLIIDGCPHIMPRVETLSDQALGRLSDLGEDRDLVRGDWAYNTLEHIVIEEHEMGDMSDNWKGLNAVSNF